MGFCPTSALCPEQTLLAAAELHVVAGRTASSGPQAELARLSPFAQKACGRAGPPTRGEGGEGPSSSLGGGPGNVADNSLPRTRAWQLCPPCQEVRGTELQRAPRSPVLLCQCPELLMS